MQKMETNQVYFITELDYRGDVPTSGVSAEMLRGVIKNAVNALFGERVSFLPFDVIYYKPLSNGYIVRTEKENYRKVAAAITVISDMNIAGEEFPVRMSVSQPASNLTLLAAIKS